jgi:hypothetical protein
MKSGYDLLIWHEGSYGPQADRLGRAALEASQALADKPGWRGTTQRQWLPSDHLAFHKTIECATQIREAQMTVVVPGMGRGFLIQRIDDFHDSLPFTEGERHDLIRSMHLRRDHPNPERKIFGALLPMYDAGQQRLAKGHDIMDAWWAWRRSAFEFEDFEHVYLCAKSSAYEIAKILIPEVVEATDFRPEPDLR